MKGLRSETQVNSTRDDFSQTSEGMKSPPPCPPPLAVDWLCPDSPCHTLESLCPPQLYSGFREGRVGLSPGTLSDSEAA